LAGGLQTHTNLEEDTLKFNGFVAEELKKIENDEAIASP